MRLARQLVALRLFLADRQQPDARALDPERDLRIDRAHHARTAAGAADGIPRSRPRRAAPPIRACVGTVGASAGRSTPGKHAERRMRGDHAAPVWPALTSAAAWPSRPRVRRHA